MGHSLHLYIVDFIIKEINPQKNDKNLDPSCGCGAFLIGLVRYYCRNYEKSVRQILRENIFGADILGYNIDRAKILLAILGLQHGENIEEQDFNLIVQDSLRADWKNNFSRNPEEKFDNILGNPPYVKFQDLSDDNRKFLLKHWTAVQEGTFNLYFAFFESLRVQFPATCGGVVHLKSII
jgi:type I restriction-modification system DNA methylase subunit